MNLNHLQNGRFLAGKGIILAILAAPLVCLAVSGCGDDQRFNTVSISDKMGNRQVQSTAGNNTKGKKTVKQPTTKNPAQPVIAQRNRAR